MSKKKILLTGAAGFAGKNFAAWFAASEGLAARYDLVAQARHARDVRHGLGLSCNLANEAATAALIADVAPAAIIHCAGRVPSHNSRVKSEDYVTGNARTMQAVVHGARAAAARPHVVLLSTAGMYEAIESLRDFKICARDVTYIKEDENLRPIHAVSDYVLSKISAEAVLASYEGPWSILRAPTIVGKDERRGNYLQQAMLNLVEGQPFAAAEMRYYSDYVAMADVAGALMASVESPAACGQTMNVGSGQAVSGHEVVRGLARIAQERGVAMQQPAVSDLDPGTTWKALALDIGKASNLIGYHPRHAFGDVLRLAFDDIFDRPNAQAYLRSIFTLKR